MSNSSKRPPPRQVPPPVQNAAQSPHARFIPREELTGYTNWTPGALGPSRPGVSLRSLTDRLQEATGDLHPSGVAPRAGIPPAAAISKPPAADVIREPSPDLESLQQAARQAGYHDGYRDGLAALESFKRSFAQQMATQVGQLVAAIDRDFQSLESDMAAALTQAATSLARQIIRSELATQPEFITQVARQAVAAISQSIRRVEMRLHPDDLALVQAGLSEEIVARGVVCIPDPTISRGGCSLQTELGSVDARIEHQWEQALRRVGQDATQWPLASEDQF